MEVIDYISATKVTVRFDDGTRVLAAAGNIRRGNVKNPYQKSVCGIGFIGEGNYGTENDLANKAWRQMLHRCYDAMCHKKRPTYTECTVAKRWHNFQNFAADYEAMIGYGNEGWHLDKDILYRDNCNYSRKTCVLVPQHLNALLTKHDAKRGKYPIGVRANRDKYNARLRIGNIQKYVGVFKTPELAFQAYKQAKEAEIKRVAKLYKNQIDPRAYQALMNYKVHKDD